MNCAARRLGARAVIPESGKLSDKERILLRLAKQQSRARRAQDRAVTTILLMAVVWMKGNL